jgi:hypothetical protein
LYLPPRAAGYRFEQRSDSGSIQIEIAGVVANVLKDGNDRKPQPAVYQLTRGAIQLSDRFEIAVHSRGVRGAGGRSRVGRAVWRAVVRRLTAAPRARGPFRARHCAA